MISPMTDKDEIYKKVLEIKKLIREQALTPHFDLKSTLAKVLSELDEIISCELDEFYNIISGYTGQVIGKCHGAGVPDVLFEEPEARFEKISKEEFDKEIE